MNNISVIEQVLLSILINKPSKIIGMKNIFITSIAKTIFNTLEKINTNGYTFNSDTLVALAAHNQVTLDLVNALKDKEGKVDDFEFYYNALQKEAAKLSLRDIVRTSVIDLESKDSFNEEAYSSLHSQMGNLLEAVKPKRSNLLSPEDMADKYMMTLKGRVAGTRRYPIGDRQVEKLIPYGAQPGFQTVIYGATGLGKSSWTTSLVNKQINLHIPNIYASPENPLDMNMDRRVSSYLNIPMEQLVNIKDESMVESIYNRYLKKFSNIKHYGYIDSTTLTIADLRANIQEFKRKLNIDYCIVTIDLTPMLLDFGKKPHEIIAAMDKFHQIARDENVHFIHVFQALEKELEKATIENFDDINNKLRPTLGHIFGSGAMAKRGRAIFNIFRLKYYAERFFPTHPTTLSMKDVAEITLQKNNNGKLGKLNYEFFPETFQFQYMPEHEMELWSKDSDGYF
jgi:replicative DNA helicase